MAPILMVSFAENFRLGRKAGLEQAVVNAPAEAAVVAETAWRKVLRFIKLNFL